MKTLSRLVLFLALVLPTLSLAQEEIIPPPVGGGTNYTRNVNGQLVEVTTVGPVEVQFAEINAYRVRGSVVRLDANAPECRATIRWVNQGLQQTITVPIGAPPQIFCIESGDIDRRSGPNQHN